MKNFYLSILVATTAFLLPSKTFAAICYSPETPGNFRDLTCFFIDIVSTAIPIVMGLASVVFFWGLAKFILNAGSEEAREQGKQVMVWGIVSLFVLISIWGIIYFVHNEFFGTTPSILPQLPTGV